MRGGYRPLHEDRVGAIKVTIAMLRTLCELGWVVQFASDIWRKGSLDKGAFPYLLSTPFCILCRLTRDRLTNNALHPQPTTPNIALDRNLLRLL
jgi:hypothetical protein